MYLLVTNKLGCNSSIIIARNILFDKNFLIKHTDLEKKQIDDLLNDNVSYSDDQYIYEDYYIVTLEEYLNNYLIKEEV